MICVCYQDMSQEELVWIEGRGVGVEGTGEGGREAGRKEGKGEIMYE